MHTFINFVSNNATAAAVVAHRGAQKPKRVLSTKAVTQEMLAVYHKYIIKSSSVQIIAKQHPTPALSLMLLARKHSHDIHNACSYTKC